ncbi:MAG TPA: hypothetical protein VL463_09510 [Kofleriaceae bacterium]|nr:hypothetical protein [Kofleriaceae bacterium]
MAQLVACVRCRAQVPVGDTTFTEKGDYLCRKCTDVVDLADQVEKARQEGLRKAGNRRGILSWWLARRQAKKEHAAMVAAMPDLDKLPSKCAKCGGPAPRGRAMCERCQPA